MIGLRPVLLLAVLAFALSACGDDSAPLYDGAGVVRKWQSEGEDGAQIDYRAIADDGALADAIVGEEVEFLEDEGWVQHNPEDPNDVRSLVSEDGESSLRIGPLRNMRRAAMLPQDRRQSDDLVDDADTVVVIQQVHRDY